MSGEIVVSETAEVVRPQQYALMPVVSSQVLVARRAAILEAMKTVMQQDVHYGVVPGAKKPSLLKAGAEELCVLFGLCPVFRLESAVEDFTGEHHGGEAYIGYTYSCELWRGDWRVATASGACNSWEVKYRYREAQIACPECGREAVRRSRDDDGGYYCWRKIGGCGKTFEPGDPRITSQPHGRVPNPDVADLQNTLVKMAQKRALVAAVLVGTGASAHFTQDIEDMAPSHSPNQTERHSSGATPRPAQNSNGQPAQNGKLEGRAAWVAAAKAAGVNPDDYDLQQRLLEHLTGKRFVINARVKMHPTHYDRMAAGLRDFLFPRGNKPEPAGATTTTTTKPDPAVAAAVGSGDDEDFEDTFSDE